MLTILWNLLKILHKNTCLIYFFLGGGQVNAVDHNTSEVFGSLMINNICGITKKKQDHVVNVIRI